MKQDPQNSVLFYDGECGLCANSVQWCLKRDRKGVLLFAPLQGSSYATIDHPDKPIDVSSMVIWEGGKIFLKSDAVLKMLVSIGAPWSVLGYLGRVCPKFLRDFFYDFVAKRRIRWFGTADFCQLPTPAHRARFID